MGTLVALVWIVGILHSWRVKATILILKERGIHRLITLLLMGAFFLCAHPSELEAASEAECAIWLCLPGGFPAGCGAAQQAFHFRVKYRLPPLPPLASCTAGPGGTEPSGRYETGYQEFETCKVGYRTRQIGVGRYSRQIACYPEDCNPEQYMPRDGSCIGYTPARKTQPNYIRLWVNDKYLGQYWY